MVSNIWGEFLCYESDCSRYGVIASKVSCMNGNYNRALTLTDFLYLIVFFLGLYSILYLDFSSIYALYIVITISLVVDWTSAFTMSSKAGNILLLSDIVTTSNYLCLYKALLVIDEGISETYLRFIFHYAILFLIYFVWNLVVIKNNSATINTQRFFMVYTVLAFICISICFAFWGLIYLNIISLSICHVFVWGICGTHLLILITWIMKTFVTKEKKWVWINYILKTQYFCL